jgi:hypothetical protein
LKIVLLEQSCFEGYHRVILFLFFSKIENNCWDGLLWIQKNHRDYKSTICCHVGVSQIMFPCWDFTNYVAMFWSSQILFSMTKKKGKDVRV